jgi:membrane associated rhomboid family serine protease
MFFPYRSDLTFHRPPIVTILVCLICVIVFYHQIKSEHELAEHAQQYCADNTSRMFDLTLQKIQAGSCAQILVALRSSTNPDKTLERLAEHTLPWSAMTDEQSRAFTLKQLTTVRDDFARTTFSPLKSRLFFDPAKFSLWHAITASLAHSDYDHIIGNLLFFFAFAATVELVIGPLAFIAVFLALAVGTHTAYAITEWLADSAIPSLGLSGVVMGMIGLFAYLLPRAKIKCFFWVFVIVKVIRIPAWFLALVYVGFDIYNLTHASNSNINFVAHVSGAAIGFLLGPLFFRRQKEDAQRQLGF